MQNNSPPYPWQQHQWDHINKLQQQNRLPHALLFHGLAGLGIDTFAKKMVAKLFCTAADKPCGQCKGCNLINQRTHADYSFIDVEEGAQAIKVDQIRQANEFFCKKAEKDNYKVLIINQADRMNRAAANAVLKTLEEPVAGKSLLILISAQSENLLATIRSRCQAVRFSSPDVMLASQWLNKNLPGVAEPELYLWLSQQAPLLISQWQKQEKLDSIKAFLLDLTSLAAGKQSSIELAKKWQDEAALWLLQIIIHWLTAVIKYDFQPEVIQHYLQKPRVPADRLFVKLDTLYQTKKIIQSNVQLNKQLMLESIFSRLTC